MPVQRAWGQGDFPAPHLGTPLGTWWPPTGFPLSTDACACYGGPVGGPVHPALPILVPPSPAAKQRAQTTVYSTNQPID